MFTNLWGWYKIFFIVNLEGFQTWKKTLLAQNVNVKNHLPSFGK